ncbi:MAG: DUF2784 domain-containing protein [Planctomycetaceae bacterium]
MPFIYRLLADLVVVFHATFVLFVVLGLPAILIGGWRNWGWVRSPPLRCLHLAMIGFVVLESWLDITCPLTTWEQWLREWSGGETYRGDFIPTLIHNWLFFDAPPWVFTLIYTLFGSVIVAATFLVPIRSSAAKEVTARSDELTAPGKRLSHNE